MAEKIDPELSLAKKGEIQTAWHALGAETTMARLTSSAEEITKFCLRRPSAQAAA